MDHKTEHFGACVPEESKILKQYHTIVSVVRIGLERAQSDQKIRTGRQGGRVAR